MASLQVSTQMTASPVQSARVAAPLSIAPAQQPAQHQSTPATPPLAQIGSDSVQLQLRRDTRVPAQPLSLSAPFDPIAAGRKNTTQGYSKANMPVPVTVALEPTFRIIDAVHPEMGKVARNLDDGDILLADDGVKDMFSKHDIYAAWTAVIRERGTANLHFGSMILDDRFWNLRDAEKASVIMHELTHSQETPIISHFQKLFGVIGNRIKGDYGDPVEDRAYLDQFKMFDKLGIDDKDEMFWGVQVYLEDRGLIEPYQF